MSVIVIVCAAFCLTVWNAKTETMSLRTKKMLDAPTIFSVKEADQV